MTNASSAGLRELCVSEIEAVSGGILSNRFISGTFTFLPTPRENLTFFNEGGDRNAAEVEARRVQAAYAANPDTPRSQVYADLFMF